MCGRTSCTLCADLLPLALTDVFAFPVPWVDEEARLRFEPSANVAPTSFTPVIIGHEDGKEEEESDDVKKETNPTDTMNVVLTSMMWGLVPFWHKGETPTSHGLSTINARLETLHSSRLYKPILNNSHRRCVVVCDGFYEWLKSDSSKDKQPYMVYNRQESKFNESDSKSSKSNVAIHQMSELTMKDSDDLYVNKEWIGPKLTYLAGLYSEWRRPNAEEEEKPLKSYTIITTEANEALKWLHNRMPLILSDKKAVNEWLDRNIEGQQVLERITPVKRSQLQFHPVSKKLGDVRNKFEWLNNPLKDEEGQEEKKKGNLMDQWVTKKKTTKKEDEKNVERTDDDDDINVKKETNGDDDFHVKKETNDDDDIRQDDEEPKRKQSKRN